MMSNGLPVWELEAETSLSFRVLSVLSEFWFHVFVLFVWPLFFFFFFFGIFSVSLTPQGWNTLRLKTFSE